ncbi:MAG: sialidase [Acidobacteria bacterium]|nr:sialidase [Acidobacteriota bacterium]
MARGFRRLRSALTSVAVVAFILGPAAWVGGRAQETASDPSGQLKFRHIGPVGNRITSVVGVPGDPLVYYVGAASGGVFKTTDAGAHWTPIFDDQPAASIGSVAIAPSDPNVVWAGTGESCVRSNVSLGNGIYKSTDGGKSFTHMGLEKTGRIGQVVIHPRDPDLVYAAALGHTYGPQQERGVFRTRDGGKTWERVLFVDENTGASDLVMDPGNPQILYAGMWPLVMYGWGRESGGPGGGIYKSRDGGTTWTRLKGRGLPDPPIGNVGLAIAQSNPNRIYALIETTDGGLWRSDDGGESWSLVNQDHNLTQRWHYYTHLAVAPNDADEVYFLAVLMTVSLDGGVSVKQVPGGRHGDNHAIWIDPTNANRIIVGNDGGVIISTNRGQSWLRPRLPNAQMYHVATDTQIPYNVYGNRQDGPSTRGPSNSRLENGEIPIGMWHEVGGCESGFAIPDPVDNNIVWADCYAGQLDRYDERTQHARSVTVWPDSPMGWPTKDLKYRFQWTTPIAISPHDHNQVYVGSQFVHQTTDGGHSWKTISPDLTTNDKTKQGPNGGLTPHNTSAEYAPTVFAIVESPLEKGLIWVGSNDGLVHVTRDGGARWANVTPNIPSLPPWGIISNIEPSRFDAGTAYITADLHQMNNRDPFVYKTTDYGKTWKSISSDIPRSVLSYAHCVREDPVRKGMLYVGTENALYVSFNDGANWVPLQSNLPHAPVHWMTIQEHFNDLVVATYGRGFWILDDIAPLRQMTPEVSRAAAHLFPPRPTYRFRFIADPMTPAEDPAAGRNAPYGAPITYHLKDGTKDEVTVTILDEQGNIVRTFPGSKAAGLNRVWWDLRYESAKEPKLRTTSLEHPHVQLGPQGWRPLVTWHRDGRIGPLAAPGKYMVQLRLGSQELRQELVVRKDPNSAGTEADTQVQAKMALALRDDISAASDTIDQIEVVRRQLQDVAALLQRDRKDVETLNAAKALEAKFAELAGHLYQTRLTGGTQDATRWPVQLYAKLMKLASDVGSSDFAPTTQQVEVHEMFKKLLAGHRRQLGTLLERDLESFKKLLSGRSITTSF